MRRRGARSNNSVDKHGHYTDERSDVRIMSKNKRSPAPTKWRKTYSILKTC